MESSNEGKVTPKYLTASRAHTEHTGYASNRNGKKPSYSEGLWCGESTIEGRISETCTSLRSQTVAYPAWSGMRWKQVGTEYLWDHRPTIRHTRVRPKSEGSMWKLTRHGFVWTSGESVCDMHEGGPGTNLIWWVMCLMHVGCMREEDLSMKNLVSTYHVSDNPLRPWHSNTTVATRLTACQPPSRAVRV